MLPRAPPTFQLTLVIRRGGGERSGAGMLASAVFVPAARGQFISPENTQEDSEAADPP